MTLKLFNTLSRKKEEFRPLKDKHAKMYTCGPTVYNYAHIGNFRAYMAADILHRYLKYKGFKVTQVMNLTDVDDKTINGSRNEGISLDEFTSKYKKAFFEDIEKLNIEKADFYPEATKTIPEIVELVKKLIEKGYAYKSSDESIYFSVTKFKDYGKLAHLDLDELKEGARVSQDEYEKGNARDFAVWKAWDTEDGNVFWETELGKGRPGWHIECSAMSMKHLGESFDIHTGGIDLIFPHHENEIAQSEGATGKKFVNYWIHNAYLIVEGEKMSKRLGNFKTLNDLEEYSPRAIRHVLMNGQYRQELNFTIQGVKDSEKFIDRTDEFVKRILDAQGTESADVSKIISETKEKFETALDDDLNVPNAVAAFSEFMKKINSQMSEGKISKKNSEEIISFLKKLNTVFGTMKFEFEIEEIDSEVEKLIQERETARAEKNWTKSDEIRNKLKEMGIVLDDTDRGTKWKKVNQNN
ncbi:MAG: cysteine--tRNA ligase [Candidatus Diapherotrites archaeon]